MSPPAYILVSWLKRTPQKLHYRRLTPPVRLVAVSDSSFSAGDTEGLVMRGCLVMLVSGDGHRTPGGSCQILDWFARKQPHVCRSTFAAELHASLDAANQSVLIQALLTELKLGTKSASTLCELQDAGRLEPPLHVCIDAKAVWDAIRVDPTAVPSDKHLMLHVLKMKEFVRSKVINTLWWIDTIDMLADGLTKGSIDREALLELCRGEPWRLRGLQPCAHRG